MAMPRTNVASLWPLLGLMLASWLVELCGLFFLQKSCAAHHDDPTWAQAAQLPSSYSCGKIYRFLWWTIVFEFPLVAGILASLLTADGGAAVRRYRNAWIGYAAISTVLHMLATNATLNVTDTYPTSTYITSEERLRAIVSTIGFGAGAALNIALLFLLGDNGTGDLRDEEEPLIDGRSATRGAGGVGTGVPTGL